MGKKGGKGQGTAAATSAAAPAVPAKAPAAAEERKGVKRAASGEAKGAHVAKAAEGGQQQKQQQQQPKAKEQRKEAPKQQHHKQQQQQQQQQQQPQPPKQKQQPKKKDQQQPAPAPAPAPASTSTQKVQQHQPPVQKHKQEAAAAQNGGGKMVKGAGKLKSAAAPAPAPAPSAKASKQAKRREAHRKMEEEEEDNDEGGVAKDEIEEFQEEEEDMDVDGDVESSGDEEDEEEDEEGADGEQLPVPPAKHPRLERSIKAKQASAAAAVESAGRWTNRQRTLVFSSRGISFRARHLLTDVRTLLPHSKKESKLDRKDHISKIIPELCELRNCNNCIYFEMRKKQDLYLWVSKVPHGPSVKFLVENVHTMDELKLTGNCLKGSRPILNFDAAFDSEPHYQLLKELLFQAFGTPNHHPKSKPFVDHVMSFFIVDGRVWIRNYQVVWKESDPDLDEHRLTEIGPRCVLQPIRIFAGSFGGPTLYENPAYVSPNQSRGAVRRAEAGRYQQRTEAKVAHMERLHDRVLPRDEVEDVFREGAKA